MKSNYVKTLLYAYPHVQMIIEQIDDIVMRKALSSMRDFSPCEGQCEKIIELTEQKKTLIFHKVKMDRVVSQMNDYELKCLDYKYFKQKKKEEYKDFDTTSRSYFRRQTRLIKKANSLIELNGMDNKWFEKNCLKISFFYELLRRVVSADKKDNKKTVKKKSIKPIEQTQLSA